ncbi:Uncharacterised protein [Vibrio cholerae]|nr:Uncharacterised protein [Vibrio cholerae]
MRLPCSISGSRVCSSFSITVMPVHQHYGSNQK